MDPRTGISPAPRSGTRPRPIRRAAPLQHAATLALASLAHHDPDGSPPCSPSHAPHRDRAGGPVLEIDASPERRDLAARRDAVDLRQVLLLHAVPRMHQPVGELAV